jgi:hypothetical protein
VAFGRMGALSATEQLRAEDHALEVATDRVQAYREPSIEHQALQYSS